ncbi:MAG: sigma 54-interacting transcriptional regulator [Planctomycetota bacterium]|nr:sigma 54-interacting transcriptional regulator [Planctomycetota bacterium]
MEISVVALSTDLELIRAMQDFKSPAVRFVTVCDADEALSHLEQSPVPTLFVDTRSESFAVAAEQVVLKLAKGVLPAVNVVTAGDAFYPSTVAADFDILDSKHLDFSSISPNSLLDSIADHVTQSIATPTPTTRRVESRTVTISTYTPEFFGVIDDLLRVAAREVTLLLIGETGTGKTTLARFVHELSSRRDRQFQDLACGALPSDLIESELFGHIRGAFTGADRNKIGRFEAAGRGTMLLDEIDVLDLKQQTKLLKIIETGDFEMVGSTETRRSEARLIVASNVNLQELVEQNKFRSDLYYRLNVLEFRLPALRDRQRDIPHLAMQFVRELCIEHSITIKSVDIAFLDALKKYSWPGNLRELKNHVRRAVLFSHDGLLTINELSRFFAKSWG